MSDENILDLIFKKGFEYWQCVQHVHMRGMRDVVDETRELVKRAKAEGHLIGDFITHIRTATGHIDITTKSDKFFGIVEKLFSETTAGDKEQA